MVDDLICIIGPDGTGKSTQCARLCEELDERGIEYERRWFRFRHYLTLPLMAVARLANLSEVRRYEGGVEVGYHYYWRSKALSYVYPRVFLIDMVIGYLVSIWPVIALQSKSVVADRYVYDTLVNIAISVGDPEFHNSRLASWFLVLVPSQTVTMLLLADADVLEERRADIRHDATMEQKVEQYRRLAADLGIEVVDASNTPDEVQTEIRARVFAEPTFE